MFANLTIYTRPSRAHFFFLIHVVLHYRVLYSHFELWLASSLYWNSTYNRGSAFIVFIGLSCDLSGDLNDGACMYMPWYIEMVRTKSACMLFHIIHRIGRTGFRGLTLEPRKFPGWKISLLYVGSFEPLISKINPRNAICMLLHISYCLWLVWNCICLFVFVSCQLITLVFKLATLHNIHCT